MINKVKGVKRKLKNVYWNIYGKIMNNPTLPHNPRSLLFICKGNICRSPFAERLAARIAKNKGYTRITFDSAGLEVSDPSPSPENAVQAARGFGVRLDDHKSKKINHELINSSDIILVMEPWQMKALKKSFSDVQNIQNKIFLMSSFDKQESGIKENFHRYTIFDPYGQLADQFELCFNRIEKCLLELLTKIDASKKFDPGSSTGKDCIQRKQLNPRILRILMI